LLDAGNCTGIDGATIAIDQRGVARPHGAACDIGAVECDLDFVFHYLPVISK
jgi:hypothetical protein